MFSTFLSVTTALPLAQGGLGHQIVANLPTDPASIFAILIVVIAVAAVLWFGRSSGGDGSKPA